jgi:hypothetical protein
MARLAVGRSLRCGDKVCCNVGNALGAFDNRPKTAYLFGNDDSGADLAFYAWLAERCVSVLHAYSTDQGLSLLEREWEGRITPQCNLLPAKCDLWVGVTVRTGARQS